MALHLTLLPLASSTAFSAKVWEALLQAAGNLGAVVTVGSGLVASLSYLDGRRISEVADAAGLGAAIAFWPGIVLAGYVYFHTAKSGLM